MMWWVINHCATISPRSWYDEASVLPLCYLKTWNDVVSDLPLCYLTLDPGMMSLIVLPLSYLKPLTMGWWGKCSKTVLPQTLDHGMMRQVFYHCATSKPEMMRRVLNHCATPSPWPCNDEVKCSTTVLPQNLRWWGECSTIVLPQALDPGIMRSSVLPLRYHSWPNSHTQYTLSSTKLECFNIVKISTQVYSFRFRQGALLRCAR